MRRLRKDPSLLCLTFTPSGKLIDDWSNFRAHSVVLEGA